jgi:Fur family peroxide stress response transcriptional regulator
MVKSYNSSEIVKQLQAKGLKITPQRVAVYANLLRRCDHPTVEQILTDLNTDLPIASKATVYSSLTSLRKVGLVREVLLEQKVCRYDAKMEPHHHFRCNVCGAIEDVDWETFKPPQLSSLRSGLQVKTYEATIHGLCDRCIGAPNPYR